MSHETTSKRTRARDALDPATLADSPDGLVRRKGISVEEKLRMLERWEAYALAQEVAENEGMPPGGPTSLREIREAQERIRRLRRERGATTFERPATPPAAEPAPEPVPPPAQRRRAPGWRSLAIILAIGLLFAAGALWISVGTVVGSALAAAVGLFVAWRLLRSLDESTDPTCTTCGGTGFVPAQNASGGRLAVPCPLCVPNDAPGG